MKRFGTKSVVALSAVLGLAVGVLSQPASAGKNEMNVGYLTYKNCGIYTVENVTLNYVDEDGKKQKLKRSMNIAGDADVKIRGKSRTCFDLANLKKKDKDGNFLKDENGQKIPLIPEGAEVWLSFQIQGGDKQSCQKRHKRFFSSESNVVQRYRSSGETKTNNSCKLGEQDEYDYAHQCIRIKKAKDC